MRFTIAAALLASSVSGLLLTERQAIPATCATGMHVIATGGDGAQNIGRYGLIETLVNNITARIPGSYGVTIDYDKGSDNKGAAIAGGAKNLNRYITQYIAKCPNTKLAVLGYSAGAIITMNTLCGSSSPWAYNAPLNSKFNKQIVVTIIYGDLTRTQNAAYNQGTCEGDYDTGPGRYPRKNPTCLPWATYMKSYCDFADPQCCVGGFDPAKHFQYPQNYDLIATDYVVSRWNATKAQSAPRPVSESSSSVAPISSTSSSSSLASPSTSVADDRASSSTATTPATSTSILGDVNAPAPTTAPTCGTCAPPVEVTTTTVVTVLA